MDLATAIYRLRHPRSRRSSFVCTISAGASSHILECSGCGGQTSYCSRYPITKRAMEWGAKHVAYCSHTYVREASYKERWQAALKYKVSIPLETLVWLQEAAALEEAGDYDSAAECSALALDSLTF